jgi:hypothetical protein
MFDDSKVSYKLFVGEEWEQVRGNAGCSGDDDHDRGVEDAICERLADGDVWAWAAVTVTARYDGADSVVGTDSLGCCNYADEEAFKRGPYYADMCVNAREDLYNALEGILYRFGCINPADNPGCVDGEPDKRDECQNCGDHHIRIKDVCLLGALGQVVVGRGYAEEDVRAVINEYMGGDDVDEWWGYIGPAVDWLEDRVAERGAE